MTVAEPTEGPTQHAAETDDAAVDEGYLRHTLAALVSPGALALSAFTLAVSGLFALVGPLALIPPFAFSTEATVESAKNLSYLGIGIAVVAIALALWSLLRPESGPQWPRLMAGAAVLVALIVIFQYAVVLLMAAYAAPAEIPVT